MNKLGLRVWLVAALCLCALGCGDDDTGSPTQDGGVDGNVSDSGPQDGAADADAAEPAVCPEGECDLVENGCDEGEACYWVAAGEDMPNEPTCLPEGEGTLDDECLQANDCAAGLFCLRGGEAPGHCAAYCCGADNQCPEDSVCGARLIDPTRPGEQTGAAYCLATSDCPLVAPQTGEGECPEGEACYLTSQSEPSRLCLAAGKKTAWEDCTVGNECVPGLQCVGLGSGDEFVCLAFCYEDDDCAETDECVSFGFTHDEALEDLGRCFPREE